MKKILALVMALCLSLVSIPAMAEMGTTFETSYHTFELPYQGLIVLRQVTRDDGAEIISFMKGSMVVSISSLHTGAYLDYGTIETTDLPGLHAAYLRGEGAHHNWINEPASFSWASGQKTSRNLIYSTLSAEDIMSSQNIVVVTEKNQNVVYSVCVSYTPGDDTVRELLTALFDGVSVKADANAAAQRNAANLVPHMFVTITADTATIRTEPKLDGPILFKAVRGEQYLYDGEEGEFYVMDIDGVTAYVSKGVSKIN